MLDVVVRLLEQTEKANDKKLILDADKFGGTMTEAQDLAETSLQVYPMMHLVQQLFQLRLSQLPLEALSGVRLSRRQAPRIQRRAGGSLLQAAAVLRVGACDVAGR
jgi:hypothetical protein